MKVFVEGCEAEYAGVDAAAEDGVRGEEMEDADDGVGTWMLEEP